MKKKIIYKVVSFITIVFPFVTYLFLSATILNVETSHTINKLGETEVLAYEMEKSLFLYDDNNLLQFRSLVYYNDEIGRFGIEVFEDDIIRIDKDYLVVAKDDNGKLELGDVNVWKIAKKEGVSIPIAVFISGFAVLIVALIYGGKMKIFKKRVRLSVFISLAVGTAILAGINLIVSNMLNVFIVALVSWGIYCIEYLVYKGLVKEDELNELTQLAKRTI